MVMEANVTFLGISSREYNGKVYRDANIEFEDGDISRVGVDAGVGDNCKKYQRYKALFKVGNSKNGLWMRMTGITELPAAPGK